MICQRCSLWPLTPRGPESSWFPPLGRAELWGGWLTGSRAAGRVGRFCSEQSAQPWAGGVVGGEGPSLPPSNFRPAVRAGECGTEPPSSPWCLAWPLLSSLLPCPCPAPSLPAGAPAHGQLVSVVKFSRSGSGCLKVDPGGRESSGPQRRVVQGGQSRDWSPGVRLPAQGFQWPHLAPGGCFPCPQQCLSCMAPRAGAAGGH